uniref:Helicase C-terminal domain-containing protein n=1 Tax=Fagus sylvatica TaxID=28930 RepID=A0A2N9E6B8_FAGSY
MELNDEWEWEWDFSAEELDSLERDALQKFATIPQQQQPSLHFNNNPITSSSNKILVAAFRKIPKATWNAKERLWIFPISSLSAAQKVLREISGYNVEVEDIDPLVHRAIAAASAVADLQDRYDRMPSHIESKLLPFQRDGVRLLLLRRWLLPTLHLLSPFLQTIQQWLNIPPSDILVVLSQCGGSNRAGYTIVSSSTKGSIHLDGLFNIISYDVVPKLQNLLMASEFKKAKYAMLLSGTPALSRPIELFKQLEALYPDVYKNVHEYGNRYCKGGIFGIYQGASNHEELHNLMKATVMIRRLKKDVLSELPVKRRQQVFLDLAEKDMKQINALFREIYTNSAEVKIPAVLDYLGTVIEAGCKFLIFAHHQPMIEAIYQFLLKKKVGCIRIDGSTPPASRHALVTDFQEKDATRAAVLSIRAGGVGLTLTAATTVIFAELSWTPGDLIQAEDRAHRIGQVSAVNIYYLLANDTVDDIIWDVVQSKLENLGQMLDGHENTLEVSSSQTRRSPAKQKTLDSFMKRCNNMDDLEHQPNTLEVSSSQTRSSPAKQKVSSSQTRSSPAKQKVSSSQTSSSPAKQKFSSSQTSSSPAKQKTLDSFMKRCNNMDDLEHQPKLKHPRH